VAPQRFEAKILITASKNGSYRPGQSILHRADPRLKVLACLLLVVLCFAAADWTQLAVVGVLSSVAVWSAAPRDGSLWRLCWMLRWLLLFTLLMHLLLSPGRTLWGTSWLSLDGLLTGTFVCLQMLLAVATSAMLAMTTSTESLAGTFGWLTQPLSRVGCRTREWQRLLLLSMDFIPVIRNEMRKASMAGTAGNAAIPPPGRMGLWTTWMQKLQGLLLHLADHGDSIAHRLAADEDSLPLPSGLSPLLPMARHDQGFSAVMALATLCYWLAG
jgi:energy-coupling factor transport system permease protein